MSLDEFKTDLCKRLLQPRFVNSNSYEPVWFLVYDPKRTVEMAGFRRSLSKYMESQGMTPVAFSVTDALWSALENSPSWSVIKQADETALDQTELMTNLFEIITNSPKENLLIDSLRSTLQSTESIHNPVLLVSGVESLHQILRPGSIESLLSGSFVCPTLFFYPGKAEGRTGLRFLNFYEVDGNYHSEHLNIPEF